MRAGGVLLVVLLGGYCSSVQIAATMSGIPLAMLGVTSIGHDPLMNTRRKQDERGHYGKKKKDQPSFHGVLILRAATSDLTSLVPPSALIDGATLDLLRPFGS